MDGIINVYKEKGYTSHDVVSIIKRLSGGGKTGHAGTLDPDAEGVLIVLLGRGTKLSDYLMDGDKEYRAFVKFGAVTSTYDLAGEIIEVHDVCFTKDELERAVNGFKGAQLQVPPMYSAIKKDGKKLYDLARKGVTVERAAREIVVYDIFVEEFNGVDEAVIYIKCGKGTYVRSICHDLGQRLGCGAYMSALTRTRAGGFSCEDGRSVGDIRSLCENGSKKELEKILIPIEAALSSYNRLTADASVEKRLYNGGKIAERFLKPVGKIEDLNVLYNEKGDLIGIYEAVKDESGAVFLKPRTMLYRSCRND